MTPACEYTTLSIRAAFFAANRINFGRFLIYWNAVGLVPALIIDWQKSAGVV
ncbi:MAG TPA: hypothetical protein VI037_10340 [Nitrososphaera sp.]